MSVNSYSGDVRLPLGPLALIVATFLLDAGIGVLINAYVAAGSSWLPTIGSLGTTVSLYLLIMNAIALILLPVLAFYLGHKHGQHIQ